MATNIFNNTNPYQTQQTEQPQPDGSGGYTYQGKSYGAGTGPFASQFPVKKAQSKETSPVKTTSNAQNTGSGASGTQTDSQTGSTTTTPVLTDEMIADLQYALGWTPDQIQQYYKINPNDAIGLAMSSMYLKKQNDLNANIGKIDAAALADAQIKATQDQSILSKYGDLATTTASNFAFNIQQLGLQAQLTSQQQQASMQQAQAAQEKQFGGAGTAYSSFRQGAQQQLNTSNQGIIKSTAADLAQQLRTQGQQAESLYGSGYAPLANANLTYLNPLTGQPVNEQGQQAPIQYNPLGLTGSYAGSYASDVASKAQDIYNLNPSTTQKL